MKKWHVAFWVVALIYIHTLDMELTTQYIGDRWDQETFPPMKHCIHAFGIYPAVWISRICIYLYLYFFLLNQEGRRWQFSILVITTVYWMSMMGWWFTLGIADWDVIVKYLKLLVPLH